VCISEQFHVSRTLLSFVHLSDMQIRDGAVKLEGPNRSTRLGWLLRAARSCWRAAKAHA